MCPELGHELGSAVGDNIFGAAMEGVDATNEGGDEFFGRESSDRYEVTHFREAADNDEQMLVPYALPFADGQGGDIVNRDIRPGAEWDW
jgi:hypothetical protein